MLMLKERIQKIISELDSYRYCHSHTLADYQITEAGPGEEEAPIDNPENWSPFTAGKDRWGGYDKNFWFRTGFSVPEEMHGKPVVYEVITGRESFWDSINPQFKVFVNGELVQGLDHNHRIVRLTESAEAGKHYEIVLHAHSGLEDVQVDLKTRISVLETETEALYFNLKVALESSGALADTDKRRADLIEMLNHAVNLLDLRKPQSDAFHTSVREANAYLEKTVYSGDMWHEGTTLQAIGHTHIDVAWRWTVAQTRHKVVRSFSTAIKLMEEYPEYIFMSSQPQLYQFVKEERPDLYEKIRQKIKEGRWEPEGAMWVEPDCNLISGESLVRQILMGTRFFQKEFGVQNKIVWLPDVFGYSAAMPQILKKSGIDYFLTSKLSWNEYNKMPYDTFMWKGIDGTEVLTHFIMAREYERVVDGFYTVYGGMLNPSQTAGAWQRYQQKELNSEVLFPYGYGDGGGGPTREMLENGRRLQKGVPGSPKVKMGKALDFFEKLDQDTAGHPRLPKWTGELYLEYHRGTYTSMAKNKKYNRTSEFLYQTVEWLSVMAKNLDQSFRYPAEQLHKGWELILLNQFHDILPGCSIPQVYETSHRQYEELIGSGREMLHAAMKQIASNMDLKETSVIVFNPHSTNRTDLAELQLPEGFEHAEVSDEAGNVMKMEQDPTGKGLFLAENVPAKGYRVFTLRKAEHKAVEAKEDLQRLSNSFFDIQFDEAGNMISIYDKKNERELLKPGSRGNVLQAFEDKPVLFDAWDINKYYEEKMWEINEVVSIESAGKGSLRTGLTIKKRFMDSVIEQTIYLYEHKPAIDFHTKVDWKEQQILVKAAFPIDVQTDKATYEIQYGNVERPTHSNTSWDAAKFEVCAHKWADLSEDNYGVSLINDCKYGHDIKDGVMRLTLLKSGTYPSPDADKGTHEFSYSLYPHSGDWREAGTVEEAYAFNNPLISITEEAHAGALPSEYSFVQSNQPNVITEVIKKAEDSDDVIIRVYESFKRRTKAVLSFNSPVQAVTECDLMENELSSIKVEKNQFSFELKPFEIKTFKLKLS
ncbi:alpha-mannosidase [Bacillus mangrovi]|uniref:Alpha-mannosidase n=1 Tax=Metabacillus mangrovi TaxID=1491830 RepID=A0A7X2S6T6_9BACI|nr:alpha-mannosidase [Metabacillus mangrovi]MTH54281.1 alpha-mannosidase [Metabacillus mangrovi]